MANLYGRGHTANRQRPVAVRGWFLVPSTGRVFVTDDPFASDLLAIVVNGDWFAYPDGHAQAGEVYLRTAGNWVLDQTLTTAPASIECATVILS